MTLKKSLKVIQTGTIRNLGVVSYSPSVVTGDRIFNRLCDIQHQRIA